MFYFVALVSGISNLMYAFKFKTEASCFIGVFGLMLWLNNFILKYVYMVWKSKDEGEWKIWMHNWNNRYRRLLSPSELFTGVLSLFIAELVISRWLR